MYFVRLLFVNEPGADSEAEPAIILSFFSFLLERQIDILANKLQIPGGIDNWLQINYKFH